MQLEPHRRGCRATSSSRRTTPRDDRARAYVVQLATRRDVDDLRDAHLDRRDRRVVALHLCGRVAADRAGRDVGDVRDVIRAPHARRRDLVAELEQRARCLNISSRHDVHTGLCARSSSWGGRAVHRSKPQIDELRGAGPGTHRRSTRPCPGCALQTSPGSATVPTHACASPRPKRPPVTVSRVERSMVSSWLVFFMTGPFCSCGASACCLARVTGRNLQESARVAQLSIGNHPRRDDDSPATIARGEPTDPLPSSRRFVRRQIRSQLRSAIAHVTKENVDPNTGGTRRRSIKR